MFYWNRDLNDVSTEYKAGYQYRGNLKTLEEAEAVAKGLNANIEDRFFIATDSGAGCSHRFDVIEPPKLGDSCSKGFNGDYYPVGEVIRISPTYTRVTTRDAKGDVHIFTRRRLTGVWSDGTFALVRGVRDERNPSF